MQSVMVISNPYKTTGSVKAAQYILIMLPFLGMVGPALFLQRNISYANLDLQFSGAENTSLISVLNYLCVYGSAFAAAYLMAKGIGFYSRGRFPWPRLLSILILSLLSYAVLAPALSGIFGTAKVLSISWFIAPMVLVAIILIKDISGFNFIFFIKKILFIICFLSILFIPIFSSVVLEVSEESILPGFSSRLWGIAPHANTLGPLAFLLIFIEMTEPSVSRARRWTYIFFGFLCFLLAQSRTTWFAGFATLFWWFTVKKISKQDSNFDLISFFTLIAISVFSAMYLVATGLSDQSAGSAVVSMSGRERIWELAFAEWEYNFFFGYGPSIWNYEYRVDNMMSFAFHAHSQFFQTIGESGAIGLVSLSVYLVVLVFVSTRCDRRSRLLVLGLMMFILMRCITEPSFRTLTIVSGDFCLHLILMIVLISYFPSSVSKKFFGGAR
jgi:hypothetical protein